MNRLEFLGRLARAKQSLKEAQIEIDLSIEMAISNACDLDAENIDLACRIATASLGIDQASLDFEALAKIFRRP